MTHSHAHDHHPGSGDTRRALLIGIGLNLGFVIVEAVFGLWSQSLALLADAGHNLSDVLGLGLALGANWLAQRRPTQRYTYGMRRSSILAALFNAIILLLGMGGIMWESVRRFSDPSPVAGGIVIGVALVGIGINTATALMFMSGRKGDLNVRGAFQHMAADAVVSLGAVLAGAVIMLTGWLWVDPVVSLVIALVVVVGTWQLLQESVKLALDAVPEAIEPQAVKAYLAGLGGVTQVHDFHIWAMSTTETALTAHLVIPAGHPGDAVLSQICHHLQDHFGIGHATIQVELGNLDHPCLLAPDHSV